MKNKLLKGSCISLAKIFLECGIIEQTNMLDLQYAFPFKIIIELKRPPNGLDCIPSAQEN